MKKYLRQIHLWLSLPAGIVLFIICLTGAILVFKDEILSVTGYASMRESPFLSVVMRLHRWLMDDSRTLGKMVVGISTLFFIFILVSGIGIYWPKRWKKRNFVVNSGLGCRRFIFDLHSVLGLYAAIILLICAFTGLMWSFQWYRDVVGFIFGLELQRGAPAWKIIKSIHFGDYAGMVSKILTSIAALIGASLPLTGYWMYFKKERRKS